MTVCCIMPLLLTNQKSITSSFLNHLTTAETGLLMTLASPTLSSKLKAAQQPGDVPSVISRSHVEQLFASG